MCIVSKIARVVLCLCLFVGAGQRAPAHGAFHQKMEVLEADLRQRPDDPGTIYKIALAYLEHGDWQSALERLDAVDRLAPEQFPTRLIRGIALTLGGRHAEAKTALDVHLKGAPRDSTGLLARARLLSVMGDARGAMADAESAVDKMPEVPAELALELAGYQAAADQPKRALKTVDRAMKTYGQLPALARRGVELELQLKRPTQALRRMDTWIKSADSREHPGLLAEKARVAASGGLPVDARQAWEDLLADMAARPPLERGTPANRELQREARAALGLSAPQSGPAIPPAPPNP